MKVKELQEKLMSLDGEKIIWMSIPIDNTTSNLHPITDIMVSDSGGSAWLTTERRNKERRLVSNRRNHDRREK